MNTLSPSEQREIQGIVFHVNKNGGEMIFYNDNYDPCIVWEEYTQDILIKADYTLTLIKSQIVVNDGHMETIPEHYIVRSPDFVKKESIKIKMRKEFGY